MPDDPLDNWLTKSAAAAELQVSEKTIERLAAKNEIERRTRRRTGARPQPVYNPSDVAKIKESQNAETFVVPKSEKTAAKPSKALVPVRPDLGAFLQALSPSEHVPLTDKLFLNLKEAARYSGLPRSLIRRLIHAQKLNAIKAGGWRIKRTDLEQLDLGQLRDLSDKPV